MYTICLHTNLIICVKVLSYKDFGIKRMSLNNFIETLFSIKDYGETHLILRIFGLKIKFPKREYALKQRENIYYEYKKNNVDITQLPPAKGQVRDIQLANLQILKEFDNVCTKAGLEYWLDFGTLLGAIRHKGFIPWDDDIDLGMMRDDYNKLVENFDKYSSNPDLYVSVETDRKNNIITKIRNKKCNHIFVDIFPMDVCSKYNIKEQILLSKKMKNFDRKVFQKRMSFQELKNVVKTAKDGYLRCDNSEKPFVVMGIEYSQPNKNWFFPKDVYFPLRKMEFENYEFPVPNNTEFYLKESYGDYMRYPSKFGMGHTMYLNLPDEEKQFIKEFIK